MKAIVLSGKGQAAWTDFPEPTMGEDCVKIKVAYCGLCGTDFHKFAGCPGSRPVVYPVPLGHEISGTVVAVGAAVKHFRVGDRVTADPNWHCGKCYYCRKGLTHLCTASRGVVKGMAEYICPPEENVYHLPDALPLDRAALTEPLSCCLHGLDLLDAHSGETVAVIGMGAIGTMMVELIRHTCGVGPIVIDVDESKRDAAMRLGASRFICSASEDAAALLADTPVERVLECVGLPVTAELAFAVAGRGATVVLFGVGGKDAVARFPLYDAFSKEIVVKTSYINPGTTGRAIAMLASGAYDTDGWISAVIAPEEVPAELAQPTLSRHGKVLVCVDGTQE